MATSSTITTLYSQLKTVTCEPTVLPPPGNEELVGTTQPVVSGTANTPISSSLLSAINSSITVHMLTHHLTMRAHMFNHQSIKEER